MRKLRKRQSPSQDWRSQFQAKFSAESQAHPVSFILLLLLAAILVAWAAMSADSRGIASTGEYAPSEAEEPSQERIDGKGPFTWVDEPEQE